jgi:hypothetical protein
MKEKQQEQCLDILNFLRDNYPDKYIFFQGPAEHALDEPLKAEYRKLIPSPMDLALIREKLTARQYPSIASFQDDMMLCFNNAKKFCKARFPDVAKTADSLQRVFKSQMDKYLNSVTVPSKPSSTSDTTRAGSSTGVLTVTMEAPAPVPAPTPAPTKPTPSLKLTVSTKSSNVASTSANSSSSVIASPAAVLPMFKVKCETILRELMKLEGAKILQEPVDLVSYPAYAIIIPHPMDFSTILLKLQRNGSSSYSSHNEFALDVRRVIGNFLRYNCTKEDSKLRQMMVKILLRFEKLWQKLEETTNDAELIFSKPMPILTALLGGIEELYRIDGILNFIYPSRYYFQGSALSDYLSIIRRPMDVGSVVSNIIEGLYSSSEDIIDDMQLIANNCKSYWAENMVGGKLTSDAELYISQSAALRDCMVRVVRNSSAGTGVDLASTPTSTRPKGPSLSSVQTTPAAAAGAVTGTAVGKTSSKASTTTSISAPKQTSSSSASGSVFTLKNPNGPKTKSTESTAISGSGDLDIKTSLEEDVPRPVIAPLKPTVRTVPASLMARLTAGTHMNSQLAVTAQTNAPAAVEKRAQAFLRDMFRVCIDEIKKHFIFSPVLNSPVMTSLPFLKAVDVSLFPDYFHIIHNPMDLAKIEKKVHCDRYPSVSSILADMELIRSNAHTYNVGEAGVEVRIMADQLVNFFKYLVKVCLVELYEGHYDDAIVPKVITDDIRESIVCAPNTDDVTTYLKAMVNAEGREYNDFVMYHFGANARRAALPASSSVGCAYGEESSSTKKRNREHRDSDERREHKKQKDHKEHKEIKEQHRGHGHGHHHQNITVGNADGDVLAVDLYEVAAHSAHTPRTHKKHKLSKKNIDTAIDLNDEDYAAVQPIASADDMAHQGMRLKESWELSIDTVLRNVLRNSYVDRSKPGAAIANFFIPLHGHSKTSSSDENKVEDMNLTVLVRMFEEGTIESEVDFVNRLLGIFQHVVDHLRTEETVWAKNLHRGCTHLVDYCWWLCLEHLNPTDSPTVNPRTRKTVDMVRDFTVAARGEQRTRRENVLKEPSSMITAPVLCKKLLKDLEKCKNRQEAKDLDFFRKPVDDRNLPDYAMYVRKPMDLSTVRNKLEENKYRTYSEFIEDCRRVFTNAIKYNGANKDTDSTGLSLIIYNAAVYLQAKLEGLLARFTIDAVDKVFKQRVVDEEFAKLRHQAEQQHMQDKEIEKEFMEQAQQQIRQQKLQEKKRKRSEMSVNTFSDDDLEDLEDVTAGVDTIRSSSLTRRSGFGDEDDALDITQSEYRNVPRRFLAMVNKKRAVLLKAWQFWTPLATVGQPKISQQHPLHERVVGACAVDTDEEISGKNERREHKVIIKPPQRQEWTLTADGEEAAAAEPSHFTPLRLFLKPRTTNLGRQPLLTEGKPFSIPQLSREEHDLRET